MCEVIVNSDDFGLSENITRATLYAIEHGLCSSTTAIVTGEAFEMGCELFRQHRFPASLGIHLNLTEGCPVTDGMRFSRFADANGCFTKKLRFVKKLEYQDEGLVATELRAQIERFRNKWGGNPSHIDGHHHVHVHSPIYPVVASLMRQFDITRIRCRSNVWRGLRSWLSPNIVRFRLADRVQHRSFIAPQFFCGGFEDYRRVRPYARTCELMIHADFTNARQLYDYVTHQEIQRIDVTDRLITYNELTVETLAKR